MYYFINVDEIENLEVEWCYCVPPERLVACVNGCSKGWITVS